MGITIALRRNIVEFLTNLPTIHDNHGQQAFLHSAGLDEELLNQLPVGTPPTHFVELLISMCLKYGRLHDGRYSLEAVLKTAKNYVGQNGKASCDAFIGEYRENRIISQNAPKVKLCMDDEVEQQEKQPQSVMKLNATDDVHIDNTSGTAYVIAGEAHASGDIIAGDKIEASVGNITQGSQIAIGKDIHQTVVVQGISEGRFEALAGELAVTKSALKSFFSILARQYIPPEDLDSTLREIAKQYADLLKRLEIIQSDDPLVQELKAQARHAIEYTEFKQAEHLLNQAEERDIEVIQQLKTDIQQRQEVLVKRLLSAAKTNAENGLLQLTQLAYSKAAKYYQRAVTLVPEEHDEIVAEYLHMAAYALDDAGKYNEAIPLAERALSIYENVFGNNHPDVADTLNNLAGLYEAMGEYKQVLPLYERALSIDEFVFGNNHPEVAITLSNLAGLYKAIGEYEQARPLYDRALSIYDDGGGNNYPEVAAALNGFAGLYKAMGNYKQALLYYERALSIDERVGGDNHPHVATTLHNLAELYKAMGDYKQALHLSSIG